MKDYKRIYLTFTLSLIVFLSVGQAPEAFKYQAVIRDASGQVIVDQDVSFQISILSSTADGTSIYSEIHAVTTNQFGLVNLNVGQGVTTDDLTNVDWGSNIFFIQVKVDQTGGTDYQLMGTTQLLSVPYALHSKSAESLTGTIIETDPIYGVSIAVGITETDTINWNNKLVVEVDGDPANEIQCLTVSETNDTLYLSDGGFVIINELSITNSSDPNSNWVAGDFWIDTRDDQKYATVEIGTQVWMAENLNYGNRIQSFETASDNDSVEKYCYGNTKLSCNQLGGLYTWNEVMEYTTTVGTQGVCPSGWHLPTQTEFNTLITYHSGGTFDKMRSTYFWGSGNNIYGFSALASGSMSSFSYYGMGGYTVFWTSDNANDTQAKAIVLSTSSTEAENTNYEKTTGISVRCIKD